MVRLKLPFFRIFTTSVLFAFTGAILLFLLADIVYVKSAPLREVLSSPDFHSAFTLSLITSVITAILSILVAVPAAYALSRFPFKGIIIFDVIVDFLIVMPVLVIGVSLLVFFRWGNELNASDSWLVRQAGAAIVFLGNIFIYNKPGIVFAQFFCSASFALRALKATFDGIDPRTEKVAMTLGCTRAGAFWRISLPLAKHGILAAAVLAWSRAFEIFGAVAIVAGSVRGKTEVMPTAIYLEFSIGRIEAALVISLVMIIEAFVILLLLRMFSRSNVFGVRGSS
jgi:molybdate transport system permease protein